MQSQIYLKNHSQETKRGWKAGLNNCRSLTDQALRGSALQAVAPTHWWGSNRNEENHGWMQNDWTKHNSIMLLYLHVNDMHSVQCKSSGLHFTLCFKDLFHTDIVYQNSSKTDLRPINHNQSHQCYLSWTHNRFILGCYTPLHNARHTKVAPSRYKFHRYQFVFKCINFNYPCCRIPQIIH